MVGGHESLTSSLQLHPTSLLELEPAALEGRPKLAGQDRVLIAVEVIVKQPHPKVKMKRRTWLRSDCIMYPYVLQSVWSLDKLSLGWRVVE
jgi:hypothetical protein